MNINVAARKRLRRFFLLGTILVTLGILVISRNTTDASLPSAPAQSERKTSMDKPTESYSADAVPPKGSQSTVEGVLKPEDGDAVQARQREIRNIKSAASKAKRLLKSFVIRFETKDTARNRRTVMIHSVLRTPRMELTKIEQTTYDMVSGKILISETRLKNWDGKWNVVGNTAILEAWNRGEIAAIANLVEDREEEPVTRKALSIHYDLYNAQWLGKECDVVVETRTQEAYEKFLANSQRHADVTNLKTPPGKGHLTATEAKKRAEDIFPYRTETWIDKETNFPVRTIRYNRSGEITSQFNAQQYETNIELSESVFDIPKSAKIVVANSQEAYSKIVKQAFLEYRAQLRNNEKNSHVKPL
jgi:hypothetical protein